MSVQRDKRTGRWFFRARVQCADGTRVRVFGTPGFGEFRDLQNSQVGGREAERRAIADVLGGVASAEARAAKEVAQKTIRQHAENFVATYKPGSKPAEKYEKQRVLNTHLLPVFGDKLVAELRQIDLDEYAADELARGMVVKTVNNQLAVLSTLIKYVTGQRSLLRFKLDGMAAELRAVGPEDVELLLEATDDRYRVVLLLAIEAGLRSGEVRGLQWTDVRDGMITVRRALDKRTNAIIAPKHNKSRTVPVSPRIAAALARLPRVGLWIIAGADGAFVPYDELAEEVGAIYGRAGVLRPTKPLHALRHTFGTEMAQRVPLPVLQSLLGHADIKTTLRYVDVTERAKRAAIATVYGDVAEAPAQRALPWPAGGQQEPSE